MSFSTGTLLAFLLTLSRVGGALAFVPIPGLKNTPPVVRAALAAVLSLALISRWPVVDAASVSVGQLMMWAATETAVGLAIGVAVSIMLEVFAMAAQALALQAGYGYASVIDPSTEADSGVLLVLAQLFGGMAFFALGLHREALRLLGASMEAIPAGSAGLKLGAAGSMIGLASGIFSTGLRLALPVIAVLLMVDISLALLGKLNQQLQLLSLAFPVKMLVALVALSLILGWFPRLLLDFSGQTWQAARRSLGI
jgi:flagellar biosynthetic protein FliR